MKTIGIVAHSAEGAALCFLTACHAVFSCSLFDELCNGIFNTNTTQLFLDAIKDLKSRGAECVILGCTEIPLIVTPENSALPTIDSTRLLAKYSVLEAISDRPLTNAGWLPLS